ncbi:hypothetical protein [Hamadaea tsunoensis]|uniref:hypothetical protein n=1 Tax=Hamadaea tsunoensis TaxID=53368 RepID=UPI000484AA3E|nr:hypothetical protein [Hamadaea tsunoensis]
MAADLTVRGQASLFALMVVARPVTNRELRDVAGLEIDAKVLRQVNRSVERVAKKKRGAVNTYRLAPAGRSWCESALVAGRPDNSKFPAGVLYAVLENIGQHLARSGIKFEEFFQPDIENWIRAAYAELTVRRGPNSWIKLSVLRPWLEGVAREVVDAELDRMIEQPDVHLMAELNQKSLTAHDREAAVDIGGEPRHLLRIGKA